MYFSKKGYELVGIEVPLNVPVTDDIKFIGYMDVVLYNTQTGRYKIIDIKTSTMGWNKYQKADKKKTNQLLLYKQFYSLEKDIPIDKIDVEYLLKVSIIDKVLFQQDQTKRIVDIVNLIKLNIVKME
jgi:hypothetical protein